MLNVKRVKNGACSLCRDDARVEKLNVVVEAFNARMDAKKNRCWVCELRCGKKGVALGNMMREMYEECNLCKQHGDCSLCCDDEKFRPVFLEQFKNSYTISNKGNCFGKNKIKS